MKQLRLTREEVGSLCLALAHLYHAGIGVGDALALLAEDEPSRVHKALFSEMARRADEGTPLAQILHETGSFPDYVCALLEVGERLGKTEDTLRALARYYASRAQMERRVRATLLYPAVLLLILLVVVVVLLVWVLPVFNEVYTRLGSSLTGVAGGLLALGAALRKAMPLLCALLLLAVVFAALLCASPRVRGALGKRWRTLLGDRGVNRRINTARFAQALAMGLGSGMSENEAVQLAARLSRGTAAFERRCGDCIALLDGGAALADALRETELLSRAECRLLASGIHGGSGELVMEQIAARLLDESERALEETAGAIEPTLVVVMSALVALILFSVMLPLMHIMTAIG